VAETDRGRRPNVYRVAERAGVSIATVSRVLGDTGPVAPETRRRVLQAVAELRWRPSRPARALAGSGHEAVGIVFPDLAGPYYAQVIRGFERQAVDHRSAVLVLATHGRENCEDMVDDLAARVDGLVVMGRTIPDDAVIELEASGVPVVLLARPPVSGALAVRAENALAAEALTTHLLGHGLERLSFLGDPDSSPDVRERWLGFVQAHRSADLTPPGAPVSCSGFEPEHGYKGALDALQGQGEVDGLVCANDELASGAYRAAETCGLSIPADVAVTGWDDIPIAGHLAPRLTTVRQPMRELGARAAALLFERIGGGEPESVVLPTSLVVRGSCGCPVRQEEVYTDE
jgi:LacI family transcriptional regulator